MLQNQQSHRWHQSPLLAPTQPSPLGPQLQQHLSTRRLNIGKQFPRWSCATKIHQISLLKKSFWNEFKPL
jgi:hypothetical protein